MDLEQAGLSEWLDPAEAACADYGSQQRLQAAIVCTMLAVASEKWVEKERAQERRLQVRFDDLKVISIALASLLKAGQV